MPHILTKTEIDALLKEFCSSLRDYPSLLIREIILFGSYSRQEADAESDVDIMILTDLNRDQLSDISKVVLDISDTLFWKYGAVISVHSQNYAFFKEWVSHLPFYRNVETEGIRYYAA